MEPAAEFLLPSEFLTDDDFLVEKENKDSVFLSEPSHVDSSFLAGLSRKMAQATLDDDDAAKAWGMTRPTTRCGGGFGCETRVSSQTAWEWDMYCAAAEYNNNHNRRGVLDHSLAASKVSNGGSGFYSRQSLQYHKLQAIQQLKQQQLMMKHQRQLAQQRVNHYFTKSTSAHVDLLPSAWPFGDRTGKRGSTGTGVFLPLPRFKQTSSVTAETRKKPARGTVLVPARVAHALNLNKSVVHHQTSFNDSSRRQWSNKSGYSNQMMIEQTVNEPRLPSDWAY